MKIKTDKKLTQRTIALLMSFLMIIGLIPVPDTGVRAADLPQENTVTITVIDEDGNPVSGAAVKYTINSASQGKTLYSGLETTNADGIVKVLDSSQYTANDLSISAEVSKAGYKTNTMSVNNLLISSADMDKQVILISETFQFKGNIQLLDIVYDGKEHNAVEVTVENPETDTILYKLNDKEWSKDVPLIKDAGDYTIYVKVSRTGYDVSYESGALTAKIAKAEITDIDLTVYEGTYDEAEHEAITIHSGIIEGDKVTYICNGEESETSPAIKDVGTKTVTLKIERSNYETYSRDFTAKVEMGVIEGVSATLNSNLVYDKGKKQELVNEVTGTKEGDIVYYKIGDGNWDTAKPEAEDAGEYQIFIKIERGEFYTPKEIELNPATVTIEKATQPIAFVKEYAEDITLDFEIEANNQYNYSITGSALTVPQITYKVENNSDSEQAAIEEIAQITDTGVLTVKKAGYNIKITATAAGDNNYKETSIEKQITIKNEETDLLSFADTAFTFILKSGTVISEQQGQKKYMDDNGVISYSAKSEGSDKDISEYGLSIEQITGKVEIINLEKLEKALIENNGTITLNITAKKSEGTKKQNTTDKNKVVYAEGQAAYQVALQFAAVPEEPYILKNPDEEIIMEANGANGWYKTAVTVVPKAGYTIAKAITDEFSDYVVFDSQGSAERSIYLKNTATDEITASIIVSQLEKIDSIKPDVNKITIDYSEPVGNDLINFYNSNVVITFTAYDETSGIEKFNWVYTRADGVSTSNLESDNGTALNVVQDSNDKTKYTATIELPKKEADQLRGYLSVTAVDNAGNESDNKTDTGKVFVRDTISPTLSIKYQLKTDDGTQQEARDKYYFSNDVEVTFYVIEANFYTEDIVVEISKNGGVAEACAVTWNSTSNQDEYEAKHTLSDEGEYVVSLKYVNQQDRSENKISDESAVIVIDKTSPVIDFSYDNDLQTATIKITEHNFRKDDIVVDTFAKTITDDIIKYDLQAYLKKCDWSTEGDVHTATVSDIFPDAIYNLTLNYKDLALNEAATKKSGKFVVDHTDPSTDEMSITYSDSLEDTIWFNKILKFYNPKYNLEDNSKVTITFTAYDKTAGIEYFTWNYIRSNDVSTDNMESFPDAKLEVVQDYKDKSKFTATIELPEREAEQLRGNIAFTATDKSKNTSNKLTDTNHIIVVDSISPEITVDYSKENREYNNKKYYKKDVIATFTVKEANFFHEDVKVMLSKNGADAEKIMPDWNDASSDIHIGTYTIPALEDHSNDGDYMFTVTYTDKSKNGMESYQSDILVIDTIRPVIEYEYYDYTADENPQSAKVTITEHNFNKGDTKVNTTAKTITGNDAAAKDLQNYLRNCEWTQNGDIYTALIPEEQFTDAIYSLKIDYSDFAENAAEQVDTDSFIVDHTAPSTDDITITYSKSVKDVILSAITFGYYNPDVTVTFTAYDITSGVDYFIWGYQKETDESEINVEIYEDSRILAIQDSEDKSKFTASILLPLNQAEQLRGNISVTVTDKYNNTSNRITDTNHVIIVDTILPTMTVEYTAADRIVENKMYYSKSITATFTVTEANFYSEDVIVEISKDGSEPTAVHPVWSDISKDVHVGTYTIDAVSNHENDGDYIITVSYADRSGNMAGAYTSNILVVDTIKPVISFDYNSNPSVQTAIVTITEHNFDKNNITLSTVSKDINGNVVNGNDLQNYLINTAQWSTNNDEHTAEISSEFVDAIYSLIFNYSDLAGNAAEQVNSGSFTVDHTRPSTEMMSIDYSVSLLDTIISNLTFGYYNPTVTVTFTAYDVTSGVDYFTWDYVRQEGASRTNIEKYENQRLNAVQDSTDKSKFMASVILPLREAEQLRGSIAFTATDYYTNTSNKITDSNYIIVVDTISPTMTAEYTQASQTVGNKMFYNKAVTAEFMITESNFNSQNVEVTVTKNGINTNISPRWSDISTDVHRGTFTIEAPADHSNDGDYVVMIAYTDQSNNQMRTYTSNILVIDTITPTVNVSYSNTNKTQTLMDSDGYSRDYYNTIQTAVITVNEHNFNPNEVNFSITAKDVAGNILDINSVCSRSDWSNNGDIHTITITYPGNANYTFDVDYTDQATNAAADYVQDYFTVDTDKPVNLTVSYSTSILDTILSNISFGFYNAKTTVTIMADDTTSSIHSFKYSYLNAAGVSTTNAELTDQIIEETDIVYSNGGATAAAIFEIPQTALDLNNQFNGTVNFNATDRSGNESDYLEDTKRIVVDNISPTASVEYNMPVQTIGNIAYYDTDVTAVVTINEANFYFEDIIISVTKEGAPYNISPSWTDNSSDVHTGSFTLSEDGDYFVSVSYTDKSSNQMEMYTSDQITIDTEIIEASITSNGEDINGKAFKGEVVPEVSFKDTNFESYEITLVRTSYADKNVDVTEKFITGHITTDAQGGSGKFDTFKIEQENDGIYTMSVLLKDKSGHIIEKTVTFTVNRYGSVYEYSDYLVSLIQNGGAYVQEVSDDLIITEYNADRLLEKSLDIEISRDGKPLDSSEYTVTPEISGVTEIGHSGWYQYEYTISKSNFSRDGVYAISVSSKDNTGNEPENTNYDDKAIKFMVDSTIPEINSISGLEDSIINAPEVTVKYTIFDNIGLKSVEVLVDGNTVDKITDFSNDLNNYSSSFTLLESKSEQHVELIAYDLADNYIDTSSDNFISAYEFHDFVTVSTNMFVRWQANKPLFWGSIGGAVAVTGIIIILIVLLKKRIKNNEE
jgi:Bacterial Ig-like domain (group 1).